MAPMRNRLKDLLKSFRQGQHGETIKQALALADEGSRSAISCNLVAYFMVQQGSGSIPPDLAEKSFRSAVRYYEFASELAPNCVETAASHGAALLALKLWDQAKRELERGIHIPDAECVDPLLHHVTVTADGCSKGQRIADAKRRIMTDLSYIEVKSQDCVFAKVIKKLGNPKVQATAILKAGGMLADELKSAQSKLLHAQLALELLRGKRLKDHEKDSVLRSALSTLDELSGTYPKSLVVGLHRSKLLVVLGHLDAAEKECCRALHIEKPDDPRDHDTPLGSTKGWKYDDRVSLMKMQILSVLNAVVSMVRDRFNALTEEHKADFLSVKVDRLLELYENDMEKSATIREAICYYKGQSHLSRIFWRCPFESDTCQQSRASNPQELLDHICDHIIDDETMHSAVLTRLMLCEFIPDFEDSYEALYLARDDEGCERLCYTTLDALFDQINEVLTGSKSKTNFRPTSLASFQDCVSRFQNENIDASNALEKAWLQLLQSFAIDKCGSLMVLVATTKWEELKNVLEKQFSEEEEVKSVLDKQITDLQTSGVVVVQGPEMSAEEHTQETGSKSVQGNHHAFMYGHGALRRRNSMTDKATPVVSSNELNDDPYANKATHASYADATLKKLPHQETCTACHFERGTTKHFNQILFHMSDLHGSIGVKCPMCSVRFLTAMALGYHMYYTHNVQIMEPPG